ncbi:hypothetical protein CVT26_000662 [Gymnopilus dilepis]|uniref:Uncharacterized protein n=1 Tax=Gymnopilus dilepis TaxID=231916 RepID=A0A409WEF6_9AGAR|nr:hypothetical protein CVT26_000662 [Gymnopilus dilepis]
MSTNNLTSASSANATLPPADSLPPRLFADLAAAVRGDHPAMARWSHPRDLICPGDPNAQWHIVEAHGLVFAYTSDQLTLRDLISFEDVDMIPVENWQQVVGFYIGRFSDRRRLSERVAAAARASARGTVLAPADVASTAPSSAEPNLVPAVVANDSTRAPRTLPALGPAFSLSEPHTTVPDIPSRPPSRFLAFSPDAIARMTPRTWELTAEVALADLAAERARRTREAAESTTSDAEMHDAGSDDYDDAPIVPADKGKGKASATKRYRVIKKMKLSKTGSTKVIRWGYKAKPKIVLEGFDSSQGDDDDDDDDDYEDRGGGDDDDEEEDDDDDDDDDGYSGDEHCGSKHRRRDDDDEDDDGNVGEGDVEDDSSSEYESARESFEEQSVRDALEAEDTPVRSSSSQTTHVSATPSPRPSSNTRVFRPLFSDSDLAPHSPHHARDTPPFRYLDSAVETPSELNITFPPTPPASNVAEPPSSQRSNLSPASFSSPPVAGPSSSQHPPSSAPSPSSSDCLVWEDYTDEQEEMIARLLFKEHEKHMERTSLD